MAVKISDILLSQNRYSLQESINVSLKNNYVYVKVFKVACSSVSLSLQKMEIDGTPVRESDLDMHTIIKSTFVKPYQLSDEALIDILSSNKYFKFSLVRNPYNRVLSCYLDKFVKSTLAQNQFRKYAEKKLGKTFKNIGLQDFVQVITTQQPSEMNPHWRMQTHQTLFPHVTFDYIGRLEDIEEFYRVVNKKLGGMLLPHVQTVNNHKTNAKELLEKYYTKELQEMVYDLYKEDFYNFSYNEDIGVKLRK